MIIYKIVWTDSNIINVQTDDAISLQPAEIESVGFLIFEDSKRIVISRDRIGLEDRGVLCIPKVNVLKKEIFK
jgi:hypothetical protein